jgi:hypothetical protein
LDHHEFHLHLLRGLCEALNSAISDSFLNSLTENVREMKFLVNSVDPMLSDAP